MELNFDNSDFQKELKILKENGIVDSTIKVESIKFNPIDILGDGKDFEKLSDDVKRQFQEEFSATIKAYLEKEEYRILMGDPTFSKEPIGLLNVPDKDLDGDLVSIFGSYQGRLPSMGYYLDTNTNPYRKPTEKRSARPHNGFTKNKKQKRRR